MKNKLGFDLELVEAIVVQGHTVLLSIFETEVEFCTFEGIDPVWCNNRQLNFKEVTNAFDMKGLLLIKDTLLKMMEVFFSENIGEFLKYDPTCPRRAKIYLRYLKLAGYTCIDYGTNNYLITYPY